MSDTTLRDFNIIFGLFVATVLYFLAGAFFMACPQYELSFFQQCSGAFYLLLSCITLISTLITLLLGAVLVMQVRTTSRAILRALWYVCSFVVLFTLAAAKFDLRGHSSFEFMSLALFPTLSLFPIVPMCIDVWIEKKLMARDHKKYDEERTKATAGVLSSSVEADH